MVAFITVNYYLKNAGCLFVIVLHGYMVFVRCRLLSFRKVCAADIISQNNSNLFFNVVLLAVQ